MGAELERVARRLVWWKRPAEALADPRRLLAQAMVYGTVEDVTANAGIFPSAPSAISSRIPRRGCSIRARGPTGTSRSA